MSASVQKNRFTAIGFHKVPAHLSKTEFEAKVDGLMDSLSRLSATQKNVTTLDVNTLLDDAMGALGFPEAPSGVLIRLECKTAEHFIEWIQDPAVEKMLLAAEEWGYITGAWGSSVDAVTRIDVAGSAERQLWVGIYKDSHASPVQFQNNVNRMIDGAVGQPVSQKNMLQHTVWFPNDDIAPHLRSLGVAAAEPTVTVMIEFQTWDHMVEICEDAEVSRHVWEANKSFGLHVDSICFGADVVSKMKGI
ncbi:hypothetical protein B0H19DRAFT_1265115 [Mycena capillaripes]|nr:hypothetical protein B0H19DRAFT_1265115 [Mycena capillaripes]